VYNIKKYQRFYILDIPFIGSVEDFNKRDYKTWFQVKDKDSISPFIATSRNWNNHCQSVYLGMKPMP
jgi:hypothetical protein